MHASPLDSVALGVGGADPLGHWRSCLVQELGTERARLVAPQAARACARRARLWLAIVLVDRLGEEGKEERASEHGSGRDAVDESPIVVCGREEAAGHRASGDSGERGNGVADPE